MRIPLKPPPAEDQTVDFGPLVEGRWIHWDKMRHLRPPQGLDTEQWWRAVKLARLPLLREIPLRDRTGTPFRLAMPDPALEMAHRIDRDAAGAISIGEQVTNPAIRDTYIVRSLMEEAISSSQLEGAATTRPVAKDMIRSGRAPKTRGERMILNNFHAMEFVREIHSKPLLPETVAELHDILTKDTLDSPDQAGRFRRDDEDICVVDEADGSVLHRPPAAAELPDRMRLMCEFANDEIPSFYLHPVVRAVLLHFWLAYDHPFVDGNGRTARGLFYWSMLNHGYWLTEFIAISSVVKRAATKYYRAFLYSETDGNDATYFVLFHLRSVLEAIDELHRDLAKRAGEIKSVEGLLRHSAAFNHRQLALLSHALRNPDATYTIQSHRITHAVVYQTARTDLQHLAETGLLIARRIGKKFVYTPTPDIHTRIRRVRA